MPLWWALARSPGSPRNVVRFGGHREPGESPAQCALRELKEESSLDLILVDAPCTYWACEGNSVPEKVQCQSHPRPILVREGADRNLSVMYLAYGSGVLAPAMETQGVLLLTRENLRTICSGPVTLEACLQRGAAALLAKPLPASAPLCPAFQARFLDALFDREPECMERFERAAPPGA